MAWRAFEDLGLTIPVLAAPMAGGPSTPELVIAAARAGSLGQLAAGYKSVGELAAQIATVRAAGGPFGINVFAPNPVPVDRAEYDRYADVIAPEARRYGLELPDGDPREDDDGWAAKLDLLRADPVPLVSFTFGVPDAATVAGLRRLGTLVVQTVTSAAEARAAVEVGVDALTVQAAAAGGHSGTLTPERRPRDVALTELVGRVRAVTDRPVLAAGGLATGEDIAAVLAAGAVAALVGTVLLRADESGASAPHRAALAEAGRGNPVLTRAFTGRPARALVNEFLARYGALAPIGYPAIHHLTSPIRKAAAAAGDPERLNLWAGTGYRQAREEPTAAILTRLAQET